MRAASLLGGVVTALVGSCATDDTPLTADGGAVDASFEARPFDSAPAPTECGGNPCDPVPTERIARGVTRCCTNAGTCGLATSATTGCFDENQPGGLDPTCPNVPIPTGIALAGCCTPAGRCGGRADSLGIGCVEGAAFGQEPVDCEYDPTNECTAAVGVTCDGPEDCAGGQCCGRLTAGRFDAFSCFDSCTEAEAVTGGLWFEVCHPGQACSNPGHECLATDQLPSFVYRCYVDGTEPSTAGSEEPGEVNCGGTVCADGQICCAREPSAPVCIPGDWQCACEPVAPDAGSDAAGDAPQDVAGDAPEDAPADASDAGTDAMSDATTDAGSDAATDASADAPPG